MLAHTQGRQGTAEAVGFLYHGVEAAEHVQSERREGTGLARAAQHVAGVLIVRVADEVTRAVAPVVADMEGFITFRRRRGMRLPRGVGIVDSTGLVEVTEHLLACGLSHQRERQRKAEECKYPF